jgi:hypothetical protein
MNFMLFFDIHVLGFVLNHMHLGLQISVSQSLAAQPASVIITWKLVRNKFQSLILVPESGTPD